MSHSLRVLFIGEGSAGVVSAELERGGYKPTYECITTEAQLHTALADGWDIAISNFAVPGFGALQALGLSRRRPSTCL